MHAEPPQLCNRGQLAPPMLLPQPHAPLLQDAPAPQDTEQALQWRASVRMLTSQASASLLLQLAVDAEQACTWHALLRSPVFPEQV